MVKQFHAMAPESSLSSAFSSAMSRRSLLKGVGAIALAQVVAGCGSRQSVDFSIQFLQQSIPTALLQEFQSNHQALGTVRFRPVETLADLYEQLAARKTTSQPAPITGMTLGDYWLTPAIRNQLIEPIDVQTMTGWSSLPPQWQSLVMRDRQGLYAPDGQAWGAPYRWGSLVIVYQIEAFEDLGWTPSDWEDLWNPDIAGYLSLLDNPRTVIGLTQKRLGNSFNTGASDGESLGSTTELVDALNTLHRQVKLYSSSAYLQPLILGDTWLAVGWSTDVLPLLRRDRRFAAVVPASGTALTADIWVRPAVMGDGQAEPPNAQSSAHTALLKEWIQFCWQPEAAQRLSIQSMAASPVLVGGDRQQLPPSLRDDSVLLPSSAILEKSEFLAPIPNTALAAYEKRWTDMRLAPAN